jgi:hypothetical protein
MSDKRMRPIVKLEPGGGDAQEQQAAAAATGGSRQRRRVDLGEEEAGAELQLQLLSANAEAQAFALQGIERERALGEQLLQRERALGEELLKAKEDILQAKAQVAELRAEIRIRDAALEAKDKAIKATAPAPAPALGGSAAVSAEDPKVLALSHALEALDVGTVSACLNFAKALSDQGILTMERLKRMPAPQAKKALQIVKMTEF